MMEIFIIQSIIRALASWNGDDMFLLKLDCGKYHDKASLCDAVYKEFLNISKTLCEKPIIIEEDWCTNLDALNDEMTGYFFDDYSAMFLIYNFKDIINSLEEKFVEPFLSIFEDLEARFPGKFILKVYDNEITDNYNTVQIECYNPADNI